MCIAPSTVACELVLFLRDVSKLWFQVDFLVGAGIKPVSIVSYNHLGNNDGMNLSAPQTFRSKVCLSGVNQHLHGTSLGWWRALMHNVSMSCLKPRCGYPMCQPCI